MDDLDRLRAEAIERRRSLEPTERVRLSTAVSERVIDAEWFRQSTSIGLYLAAGAEVDPALIGWHARRAGCSTWYPVAAEGPMRFRHWDGVAQLRPGRFGISVPPPADECLGSELDAVIVPLVLFGTGGLRVGRGGGHYDRTFAGRTAEGRPHVLCGLAYDFQEDASLTPQAWDVPLDVVVTPSRTVTGPPTGAAGSG